LNRRISRIDNCSCRDYEKTPQKIQIQGSSFNKAEIHELRKIVGNISLIKYLPRIPINILEAIK